MLVKYDAMCRAIDDAFKVDEVKDLRDKALAIEHYARQAGNTEAERRCSEIRLRAERKWGQLYSASQKASAGRPPGNRSDDTTNYRGGGRTLADMGVSKDQSSQWQQLAKVPASQFEAALAAPSKPTTQGIIAGASPQLDRLTPAPVQVTDQALWLWGRLRDFEKKGLLDSDPFTAISTMTDEMREDVLRLAPAVATWLGRIGEP